MPDNAVDVQATKGGQFDLDAVYHRKTIAWRKEENGTIIIRWGDMYHVLNPTAAYMWEIWDDEITAREAVDRFIEHYREVEPRTEHLRECAMELLEDMAIKYLIAKPDSVWDEDWDEDWDDEWSESDESSAHLVD